MHAQNSRNSVGEDTRAVELDRRFASALPDILQAGQDKTGNENWGGRAHARHAARCLGAAGRETGTLPLISAPGRIWVTS